ncbi:MAG: hypothetical protein ACQ5SW_11655 [Sphaerochaetaceae bacterium]
MKLIEAAQARSGDYFYLSAVDRFRDLYSPQREVEPEVPDEEIMQISARIPAKVIYDTDALGRILEMSRNAIIVDALKAYNRKVSAELMEYASEFDQATGSNDLRSILEEQLDMFQE